MDFKIGSWLIEDDRSSLIVRYVGVEELEDREKNHEKTHNEKLSISYKPNCTDEWLELIHDIGFDYDGYNTVEGLKELIDELVDMATEARKCLHEGNVFKNENKTTSIEELEECMKINNVVHEIFGKMRHLTPEENEKKRDMYRRMSTSLDTNYFIEKLSFAASNGFTLDTKEDIEELASFLSNEINKEW